MAASSGDDVGDGPRKITNIVSWHGRTAREFTAMYCPPCDFLDDLATIYRGAG